ncbi:MAG TPA: DUF6789 family protein [Chloroflexota bacterium]|nr:DUF6789 family protein [Chloroflexota bacterium]
MTLAKRLVRGAVSGFLATVPMTATIYRAKEVGLLVRPPPKEVTGRAARQVHVRRGLSHQAFQLSWLAAHFGFGTTAGAVYGLLRPTLPRSRALAGGLFGSAIWALFYVRVLPDLGLYPPPRQDRPTRTATMIAAHLVFGGATALAFRALAGDSSPVVKATQALPEIANQ